MSDFFLSPPRFRGLYLALLIQASVIVSVHVLSLFHGVCVLKTRAFAHAESPPQFVIVGCCCFLNLLNFTVTKRPLLNFFHQRCSNREFCPVTAYQYSSLNHLGPFMSDTWHPLTVHNMSELMWWSILNNT